MYNFDKLTYETANDMRKIASISMAAVLAVSCSSELQFDSPEYIQQQDTRDLSQKFDDVVSKAFLGFDDSNLLEAAGIYTSFAREILTRDYTTVLIPQIGNVVRPDFENGVLHFDLNRISGRFTPDENNGWTYTPDDGLVFGFPDSQGDSCQFVLRFGEYDTYSIWPCDFLAFEMPCGVAMEMDKNDMTVNGGTLEFAYEDDVLTMAGGFSDGKNLALFETDTWMEDDSCKFSESLLIFNGQGNILSLESTNADGNDLDYALVVGDKDDDCYMKFTGAIDEFKEFASLLAANAELAANPSDSLRNALGARIDAFNEATPIEFNFVDKNLIGNNAIGYVLLGLYGPDSLCSHYRVDMEIKYFLSKDDTSTDGQTITISYRFKESVATKLAIGIQAVFESFERSLENLVINGIGQIRSDIEEFCQINVNYFSSLKDYFTRLAGRYIEYEEKLQSFRETFGQYFANYGMRPLK